MNEHLRKQTTNKTLITLTKYSSILILIIICLLSYLTFLNVSYSKQLKEKRASLLITQLSLKKTKADYNDLLIQKDNLIKANSTITQDISNVTNSVFSQAAEVNIINSNNQMNQNMVLLLQAQLKQKENDINGLIALIKSYNDIITLQKAIKEVTNNIKPERGRIGIDSNILTTQQEFNTIKSWFQFKEYFDMKLLYRQVTQDTIDPSIFHDTCDQYHYTLTLVKIKNGSIIGGYTFQSWDGNGYKEDPHAFLFNLTLEKKYPISDPSKAINPNPRLLPCFGKSDLFLYSSFLVSIFPTSYGKDSPDFDLTQGGRIVDITEIEIFQIIIG